MGEGAFLYVCFYKDCAPLELGLRFWEGGISPHPGPLPIMGEGAFLGRGGTRPYLLCDGAAADDFIFCGVLA